ncbi:MAG: lipocalin-like domain-containing protein [Candidatus Acidiferrum sp.]|jgi:hypothetical protein
MLMSLSLLGRADSNPLLGTWKLKSYVVTTKKGETSTPYGEHPIGYLTYSADGRMQVIGTANRRLAPHGVAPTNEELAALHKTMFAYAGRYSQEEGRVIHHVDASWNHVWNGTDQVRCYEVSGNTLTITARVVDPASGTETQYVIAWEKVTSQR